MMQMFGEKPDLLLQNLPVMDNLETPSASQMPAGTFSRNRLLILAETVQPHSPEEQEYHDELWARFLPFLVIALSIYTLLAVCWVLWNIYTYQRDMTNAQKGRAVNRLYEKWRLLSIYDQVPLPTESNNPNLSNNAKEENNNSTSRNDGQRQSLLIQMAS